MYHFSYYFFDTNQSPLLETFYLLYVVAVYFIVNVFLTKNFVFFAVCLYVVGMYDELMLELRKIDVVRSSDRSRRIKQCARIHVELIELILNFNIWLALIFK